uniref:Family with sequence similarity 162 member A n=1 Tax=Monopterus albus TaxID=43700 RepID=A0A3Q3QBH5_MONAL|nr:protein FAM162B-like [Monopterus albus]
MNFLRFRLSIGNFLGQRCRQVTETWKHRGMCTKPQEAKAEIATPSHAPRPAFKLPGYKPSSMDRKFLLWTGRFKTKEQIPEFVSYEMIDGARNKMRVKVCYIMIVATLGTCMLMVTLGKRAAARNETLTSMNLEKKARWREELQKENEAALALSKKVQ